jgi:hypothetical protein
MRLFSGLAALLLGAAFASAPAHAYTPESGIWWNPNESGTGAVIEVQDNLMVVAAYVGDAQGDAIWYTATAFLQGNALFEGSLDLTEGSQCIGCPYLGLPTVVPGAGGALRIVFDPDDETRASLTWANGRTIPIERFEFYTRRPEDGNSVPTDITKMLGEWQWVTDFSDLNTGAFPYFGDVLVFDQFDFSNGNNRWFYEGCRADNSQDGGCSQNALAFHSASGYYDASVDLQLIVVDDSTTQYALYIAPIGTNDTNHPGAEITVYPKNSNPNDFDAFPARAFRTASRTFVEEGVGPAKGAESQFVGRKPGLSDMLSASGLGLQKSAAPKSNYDRAALAPIIEQLEARIEARQR